MHPHVLYVTFNSTGNFGNKMIGMLYNHTPKLESFNLGVQNLLHPKITSTIWPCDSQFKSEVQSLLVVLIDLTVIQ